MTARALLAAAALAAALPAAAYVRTCDPDTGACLSWPTGQASWRVNASRPSTSASPGCTAEAVDAALRAGFSAWETASDGGPACTSVRLPYGGTSAARAIGLGTEGEHVVIFRQGWCSAKAAPGDPCRAAGTCPEVHNCFDDTGPIYDRSTLALTTVLYVERDGRIVDADMEIADWGGGGGSLSNQVPSDGWYFTCVEPSGPSSPPTCSSYGQAGCVFVDLQNTLTHEAGHFIGLAHTCGADVGITCTPAVAATTMFPTAPPRETQKRTLSPDDVAAVCGVYPAFEPGPVVPGTSLAPGSNGGCGAGAGGLLAGLAAVAALARLRRRPYVTTR